MRLYSFSIEYYEIDTAAHAIVRVRETDGSERGELHLTPTEWRLLEILLSAPGQLVGSQRLLADVWGPGFERSTHYLRFHMAGLRRKLEDDPHRPRHLLTEPGMGYRYQPWQGGCSDAGRPCRNFKREPDALGISGPDSATAIA